MIIVDILIPLAGNDGIAFTQEHHRVFESVLNDHIGGHTRLAGTLVGGWRDAAGKVYTDYSVVYRVAVPSIIATSGLAKVVGFAKRHYSQEAIFVSYMGLAEIL